MWVLAELDHLVDSLLLLHEHLQFVVNIGVRGGIWSHGVVDVSVHLADSDYTVFVASLEEIVVFEILPRDLYIKNQEHLIRAVVLQQVLVLIRRVQMSVQHF